MAQEIEGITIRFGAETREFDTSVHGINQGLKLLKRELGGLNKELKFDPKNIDLYKSKVQNLEEQLKLVRKRNQEYNSTLEEMGKRTSANAKLFDDLQGKIIDGEAQARKLANQIENLNAKINALPTKRFEDLGKSMQNVGAKVSNIGKALAPLSALSGGFIAKATSDAISFESAFAGVEKTVNATEPQLEKIKEGIIELSTVLPSSAEEISAVAESAGQLGIKTEDILDFTETMIGLASATNLTSEDASTMIAQFANVTGMQGDFDKLGSTLVALGNNGASTERDIMELAQRLGGAGTTAGLTEQEILGLSSSMANVGINAEAGGTAMSTWISGISMAVARGGEDLEGFLEVSQMTSTEFTELWNTDPTKVLQELLNGLRRIDEEGGSSLLALSDIGIEGTRSRDMILRLANAENSIANAVELANQSWEENIALSTEVSKRNETLASQLDISKNLFADISRTIGENFTPILIKFNEIVKSLHERFTQLQPSTQAFISNLLLITTALSPVALAIGKVISIVGSLMVKLAPIGKAIAGIVAGLNPVTAVIGAVIGALTYAIATNEKVQASLKKIWEQITLLFAPAWHIVTQTIQGIVIPVVQALINILDWLSTVIIQPIASFLADFLVPILVSVANTMLFLVDGAITLLGGGLQILIAFFTELFDGVGKLWQALSEVEWIQTIITLFEQFCGWVTNAVTIVTDFIATIHTALDSVFSFVGSVGDTISGWFSSGGLGINAELMASGGLGIRNLTVNAPINVNNQGQPIGAEQVNGWIEQIADGVSVVLGRRLTY